VQSGHGSTSNAVVTGDRQFYGPDVLFVSVFNPLRRPTFRPKFAKPIPSPMLPAPPPIHTFWDMSGREDDTLALKIKKITATETESSVSIESPPENTMSNSDQNYNIAGSTLEEDTRSQLTPPEEPSPVMKPLVLTPEDLESIPMQNLPPCENRADLPPSDGCSGSGTESTGVSHRQPLVCISGLEGWLWRSRVDGERSAVKKGVKQIEITKHAS
jgi:hypothetical protein